MQNIDFIIDQEKCTHCGKCSSECPVLIIDRKTEFPTIKEGKEKNCLKCQHCLAVCPEGALSIWGKSPEDSLLVNSPKPASEELVNLMKTRRSIRRFKKEEVDKSLIQELVKAASYAPTAKNENAVRFTLIDNRADMDKLRELAYQTIGDVFEAGQLPQAYQHLNNFKAVWDDKSIDVIFRSAPHALIVSAPKSCTSPTVDSTIAMSYFDLLANASGLGTLWDGFAKNLLEDVPSAIKQSLEIPEEHGVEMVVIFGYPAVKFARAIQNDEPDINTLSL